MTIDTKHAHASTFAARTSCELGYRVERRRPFSRAFGSASLSIAILTVALCSIDAHASAESEAIARQTDEQALLGWAVHLSRYVSDDRLPEIRYEPHRFFVERACRGREDCRVLGWYDDRDIVYVDETLRDMDTLFQRSLLVHELVHVLQHRSGEFDEDDCSRFVAREREAYAVQRSFFVAHGAIPMVRARHYACPSNAIDATTASATEVEKTADEATRSARTPQAFVAQRTRPRVAAGDRHCPAGAAACLHDSLAPPNDPSGRIE